MLTNCTGTVNTEVRAQVSFGVTDCSMTKDNGTDYHEVKIPVDDKCHIIEAPYLDGYKQPGDPARDVFAVKALKILPQPKCFTSYAEYPAPANSSDPCTCSGSERN